MLKQKLLGQSIMVSDFIDELDGFLECNGEAVLEHQKDGYFTNDMFIEQLKKAFNIFEHIYPGHLGLLTMHYHIVKSLQIP